jgi:hypothetical protein
MSSLFSALGWFLTVTCLCLTVYFGFLAVTATGLPFFVYGSLFVAGVVLALLTAATTDAYNSAE